MRLDDIRELIQAQAPRLNVNVHTIHGNPSNRRVEGHRDSIEAATVLRTTGAFDREVDAILADENFVGAIDPITTVSTLAENFSAKIDELKSASHAVNRALLALQLEATPTQVAIRLPGNSNLSGLVSDMGVLDKLLNQAVVNDHVKGEVKVAGFDRGSEWLQLDLGSLQAVAMLVMMYKSLLWFREKEQDIRTKRALAESLELDNDTKKKFNDALDNQFEEHERETLELILSAGKIPADNHELSQRVVNSTKSLATLVNKGLEIAPTSDTPETIKTLFDGADSFPAAQKQLGSGLTEEGEDQDDSEATNEHDNGDEGEPNS